MNRLRAGGGGITVDTDATAWGAAVSAAGGTYTLATLVALSNFCTQAKASGYWTKINRINMFCGDQLAAALVPLKVGGGNATETNVNFVSGDYTEATGLSGDGTTKYLRTGLIPSVSLATNDTHLSIYNRAGVPASRGCIGAWTDATPTAALSLFAPLADGNMYSDQYNAVAGRLSAAVTAPYGHMLGTRTASNVHTIYENGSSSGSNATNAGSLPAIECYVFANNQAGSPLASTISNGPLAGYSIGSGLTGADALAFATHMEAFQDALGRGVI